MAQGEAAHHVNSKDKPPTNPLLSLFSKFFTKPQQQEVKDEPQMKAENPITDEIVKRVGEEQSSDKPDVVRFPVTQSQVPSLKLESDEVENDTNPIVLWQVYALGGFIILKWVWAKWQERKANAKKDSSGEENPPTDD